MRVVVNDRVFVNGKDVVSLVYFFLSWDFFKDIFLMVEYIMIRINKLL